MSSARDITRAAWPARSVFLDYPLGHTSGRANEPELNRAIMRDTLAAFESLSEPGSMAHLPYRWSQDDDWKDRVFAPVDSSDSSDGSDGSDSGEAGSATYEDDRVARHDTPQYQTLQDESAAHATHADQECLVCAGIDF